MSESPVTFREKLVKFGTWIFLVFLFAIIVVSFGMPDFMGSSSRMDAYNAAKVGTEYLSKNEVAEYQKRIEERMMQNMKGLDEKNRKLFEDMAKGRALDEAIDRKIFTQILNRAGYVPMSSSEGKILATFYKRQFGEFIVNGKLDTERLNEFLSQRRLTLDQVGRNMLHDYGPQKAYEMLQATSFASDFAVLDDVRFATTQNSFRIVAVDSGSKDKILRAKFNPTEQEIQDKFKTEFLSKDPKSILDQPKRDTIKATLFNEKRATLEKDFSAALTQASKTGIDAVATAAGATAITIADVGLATDLDSKKGKENAAVSLSPLSQSDVFVKQRVSAPIGQIVGPVDAGGFTYFFVVTGRKSSALPPAAAYAKIENGAAELAKVKDLPKDLTFEKSFDTAGKGNYGQLLTAALEIHRHNIRIVRYNKAKGAPEN
jgi:SurA N-terminal domain